MPNKLGGLQYLNATKAAAYMGYLISSDEDGDSDSEESTKASRKKESEKIAKKKTNKKTTPRSKRTAKLPSKTVSNGNSSIENASSSSGEEESVHVSSEEEARVRVSKEIAKKKEKVESQPISNSSTKGTTIRFERLFPICNFNEVWLASSRFSGHKKIYAHSTRAKYVR
ncbi:unnamed protein product [Rodentolepis nana]|uniref:Uncharacterized protein n=1 Tax=Rodentolepis nana TaxID=102285 RepID=A0A0R3TFS1_RODNA|nr:unnamed protein product [Rodentolepis nana]